MSKFEEAAKKYIERGFSVIPVSEHGKMPYKNYPWSTEKLSLDDLSHYASILNIGILLGERSNGLTDLDFDVREAAIMGNKVFSSFPSFGRKSSPNSHRIVRCADGGKTKKFALTKEEAESAGFEKNTILEVRCDGAYTVFPPSIHQSGEPIRWHGELPQELPKISYRDISKQAGLCAFLAVILKKYPTQQGTRDEVCMALAGTLMRAEIDPDKADDLIVYIAEQKGDDEALKRKKCHASKERLDADEEVSGLPKLCVLLGIEAIENTLHKWLYGSAPSNDAEAEIEKMNERFFVVENEGSKCRVAFFQKQPIEKGLMRDVLILQSFPDFSNRFMHRQIIVGETQDGKPIFKPLGKYWLDHPKRRQYEQIVFCPGQETPAEMFNLWRDFPYRPVKGPWRKMQRHIWCVLAKRNPEAFKYIIRWAAWSVQNPAEPAEVALVFRGGKGTGKGTFCRWLKLLFGQHGLQIFSSNHFSGRFNGHLRDCVLLFADEAIAPNNKDAEGILKGMLTEPTIPIEGKGRDVIQVPNHLHVVMASNAEWVVPASADERRFAVFDVSDEVAGQKEWFTPLNVEMENGGAEAMLYFLQNLDLKGWHPRENIPSNTALNDQRIESLSGGDRVYFDWLYSADAEGFIEGDRIFVQTREFAALAGISTTAAGRYLAEMGFKQDRSRRPSGWVTPPLPEARRIWDSKRFVFSWDNAASWSTMPEGCPPVF